MSVLKVTDSVECYRQAALSAHVRMLAGRGGDDVSTEFANARILEALEPTQADVLLDIGCGDGCLLRMAEGRVGRSVGIVPTAEEKSKLLASYPSLTVLVGRAQKLPVDSGGASLIVCNSVLLLLKSEENVMAALSEIVRVARPGAKIWLGEIPSVDEYPYFKNYRGTSVMGLLWHQLTNRGFYTFLSTGKQVCRSLLGKETLVLSAGEIYYETPEKFMGLAQKCGMQPKAHFKYVRKDRRGNLIESPFRHNYVFTR